MNLYPEGSMFEAETAFSTPGKSTAFLTKSIYYNCLNIPYRRIDLKSRNSCSSLELTYMVLYEKSSGLYH